MKRAQLFFLSLLLFSTLASAQQKLKRTYRLRPHTFIHAVSYTSGNAILFIEKDSLLQYYNNLVTKSGFAIDFKGRIKSFADSISTMPGDPLEISGMIVDQGLKNVTEDYFLFCITGKKQVIVQNKRTKKMIRKIRTKKFVQKRKGGSFVGHDFYLPHDKQRFMRRMESIRCQVTFL